RREPLEIELGVEMLGEPRVDALETRAVVLDGAGGGHRSAYVTSRRTPGDRVRYESQAASKAFRTHCRMPPREFLIDTSAYLAPAHVRDGLTAADADRRVEGAPHTIAEIVAHLAFWQAWFLGRCEGTAAPMPSSAAFGWVSPDPGTWDAARAGFVDGLE